MRLNARPTPLNRRRTGLFLWAVLSACAHRVPVSQVRSDPSQVLDETARAQGAVRSLKGEGRLTARSPGGGGTTSVFIAAERPSSLHVEVLDFFGRPSLSLVSDGRRFGLYQGQEGVYYQGPASAENVSRFLPVVLEPRALVELILGGAPILPGTPGALRFEPGSGTYALSMVRGAAAQTLTIDARTFRARAVDSLSAGGYRATFSDFGSGPVAFPRRLHVEAPAGRATVDLRYTQVDLNRPLDPTLFAPSPPPNVRTVEVDSYGRPTGTREPQDSSPDRLGSR